MTSERRPRGTAYARLDLLHRVLPRVLALDLDVLVLELLAEGEKCPISALELMRDLVGFRACSNRDP
jgi:hypothetical protein